MNCIAAAATALAIVCTGTQPATPTSAIAVWNQSHPEPAPVTKEMTLRPGETLLPPVIGDTFGDFFPFYGAFDHGYTRHVSRIDGPRALGGYRLPCCTRTGYRRSLPASYLRQYGPVSGMRYSTPFRRQ